MVTSVDRDANRARVCDPSSIYNNYRPRWIRLSALHETGTTPTGTDRRTGYRLLSEFTSADQMLCIHCFHWTPREQMQLTPSGAYEGVCKPCATEFAAMLPRH